MNPELVQGWFRTIFEPLVPGPHLSGWLNPKSFDLVQTRLEVWGSKHIQIEASTIEGHARRILKL